MLIQRIVVLITCLLSINLVSYAQEELWGMPNKGGEDDIGSIIKIDPDGSDFEKIFDFEISAEGENPRGSLLLANNGLFYGVTEEGGAYGFGLLFSFNAETGEIRKIIDFDGVNLGKNPNSGLIQASDGLLYGLTSNGGAFNFGVLYRFNPITEIATGITYFNGTEKGAVPNGALIEFTNGKLYGLTSGGGTNDLGVLFEINPSDDTFTKLKDFGPTVGASPYGNLTIEGDRLFGLTSSGGVNDKGTVFKYIPATNELTKIFDFDGSGFGANPFGSMILASDGLLYGMTYYGGSSNFGTIFRLDPATETLENLFNFNGVGKGKYPFNNFLETTSGMMYGITQLGGTNDDGVLFSFDPSSGIVTKKVDFNDNDLGSLPQAGLVEGINGNLYGLTLLGGIGDEGTLFSYDPTIEEIQKLFDFAGSINGKIPEASFVQHTNGKLFGMTTKGGYYNQGVLFEIDPYFNTFRKVIDFERVGLGSSPVGKLLLASNGKYYGTTESGGINNNGTLFEFDPQTEILTKKKDFLLGSTGFNPNGYLVQHTNGKIYGLTKRGGTNNAGGLFEYDITSNILTLVHDFETDDGDGINPTGGLTLLADGKLYGTASKGGSKNRGTLFSYDPATDTYTVIHDFIPAIKGVNPVGSLLAASDGLLYGMTNKGGGDNSGVVFSINPSNNNYKVVLDLDGLPADGPFGSLIELTDGNFYAFTEKGGINNLGNIIKVNPSAPDLVSLYDFDDIDGIKPTDDLISIEKCPANVFITQQPLTTEGCSGSRAELRVEADGIGPLHYQWYKGGNPVGDDNSEYIMDPAGLTDADSYFVEVSDNCGTVNSVTVEVTIYDTSDAGTLSGGSIACESGNTSVLELTDYTGDIIRWEYSEDEGDSWSEIIHIDPVYNAEDLVVNTLFRVIVANGSCSEAISNTQEIRIEEESVSGIISGEEAVCEGSNTNTLTVSGFFGEVQKWQYKTVSGSAWTDISNPSDTYTAVDLNESTEYRVFVRNGVCSEVTSDPFLVNVDTQPVPGSISGAGKVCIGTNSTELELTDFDGEIVTWEYSNDDGNSWINLNHSNLTYIADDLTSSRLYRVLVSNGTCDGVYSDQVLIDVIESSDPGSLEDDQSVCLSGNLVELQLQGYTGDILIWQKSTNGGSTWMDIDHQEDIYNETDITENTDFRVQVQNGTCDPVFSESVTVSVVVDLTWYVDQDGDGYGNPDETVIDCQQPDGTVENMDDCDDTDPDIYPGAPALPDGKDNNCDGEIDKAGQEIVFSQIEDISLTEGTFTLEASSSSGLPVQFSTDSDKITIDGATVTLLDPGIVSITANQTGNEVYLAAEEVSQTFCIIAGKPEITQIGSESNILLKSSYPQGNQWFFEGESLSNAEDNILKVNVPGPYTVQVSFEGCPSGPVSDPFLIDKVFAGIKISETEFIFDGRPKSPVVATDPEDLEYSITYNGSSELPVDAGTYEIRVTIEDDVYKGTATGTITIYKAIAEILISDLEFMYDGEPKEVSVTTVPEGLDYDITYNGSTELPVETGEYDVLVTIMDVNYSGSAEEFLIIKPPLGLEPENLSSSITLFPNPVTNGTLNIELDNSWKDFSVDLLNHEGKLIKSYRNLTTINFHEVDGNYFIVLIKDDSRQVYKKVFKR